MIEIEWKEEGDVYSDNYRVVYSGGKNNNIGDGIILTKEWGERIHFKILKILKNRRHSWIGYIIRHNEFVINMLEGAISGKKKAVGRPRLQYLKQVTRNTAADSYATMERMACNNSGWKTASQTKD
jgi:hypothetical protein